MSRSITGRERIDACLDFVGLPRTTEGETPSAAVTRLEHYYYFDHEKRIGNWRVETRLEYIERHQAGIKARRENRHA